MEESLNAGFECVLCEDSCSSMEDLRSHLSIAHMSTLKDSACALATDMCACAPLRGLLKGALNFTEENTTITFFLQIASDPLCRHHHHHHYFA